MNGGQAVIRRFTLLADGPSDMALMPVLRWLWEQNRPGEVPIGQFADLEYSSLAGRSLDDRLGPALELHPCDLLIVHRDAEKESLGKRAAEIRSALAKIIHTPPLVCVIPMRMSEAWMLFNESAIRKAAENPRGTARLTLPAFNRIENLPDPKEVLYDLLKTACGLPTQRLRKFKIHSAARLVTEFIDDFSPLRQLPAFAKMEAEFKEIKL